MLYTAEAIDRALGEFLRFTTDEVFEDSPENRAILRREIDDCFDGEYTSKNLRTAGETVASKLKPKPPTPKKKLPVVRVDRAVWNTVCDGFPWMARTDPNILIVCDWLQHNSDGAFSVNSVTAAVTVLGKSALDHIPVPVVVAAPQPPPPPPRFDWNSIDDVQEIPLVSPVDGSPCPMWRLQRATPEQVRSFVKRDAEAKKSNASATLREGQLALDADEATMRAANPAQLHDLVRRRQAAGYR